MAGKTSGKNIFVNSVIYTISGLLMKCFNFFLLPLYTAYLTTDDYGITAIAGSFSGTMGFIVSFSLYAVSSRFYVDYKDDKEKLKRFYGTIITFIFLSGVTFAIVLIACKDLLSKYIFSGIDFYPIILVCTISLIFGCLHSMYDSILRGRQNAMKCSILSISSFFMNLGFNILFVVVMRKGALGTLLAGLIVNVAYTAYFIIDMVIHKEIKFGIDWSILKPSLKYSIPLIPHNLSAQISVLISQVFIGNAASLAMVGIYNVAAHFGQMADTVQGYVNMAYTPWLFEKLHDKVDGYKKTLKHTAGMLTVIIGLFQICLALFSQDCILLFLNESYAESWNFVPFIVGVYAIKTIYIFYISILFYYKKASKFIFVATLSSSIVNILLSAWWIPIWGVYGSVIADAVAMLIRVAIVVFISKQFEDIGLKVRDFVYSTVLLCLFIALGIFPSYFIFDNEFSLINLAYKFGIVVLYAIVVGFPYRKSLWNFAKKIGGKLKITKRS